MANVRNANTYYADTTGSITSKNIAVYGVVITPIGGTADIILQDVTTSANKMRLEVADGTSEFFNFAVTPIIFPNGFSISTLTNCVATFFIKESQK